MRTNFWGDTRMIGAGAGVLLVLVIAAGVLLSSGTVGHVHAGALAQGGFATVTPVPPDPLDGQRTGFINQYAMRLWQEGDLVDVFISQLRRLNAGEDVPVVALQLTQYELEQRFPGAPRDAATRERVLNLMLDAPRGSVDMRDYARPFVVRQINTQAIPANLEVSVTLAGFLVETIPANANGDAFGDFFVYARFPADEEHPALYEEYFPVLGTESGAYFLPPISAAWPAAPLGDIDGVELVRTGDLNADGLDEIAVSVERDALNRELVIAEWRNGEVISLVQPDTPLLYAEITDWPQNSTALVVDTYRLESARWGCVSESSQPWAYRSNFFRPVQTMTATFSLLDSIGCELFAAEPVFEGPVGDSIDTVLGALARADDPTTPDYARAGMALALLYIVDGQPAQATQQIDLLRGFATGNEWLTGQIDTFTSTLDSDPDISPVELCARLTLRDETAACDVDQLLARLFEAEPIPRGSDLVEELEARGLTVLDRIDRNEVGRLPRQLVNFNLTGASWWEFVASDPDFLVPSIAEAPPALGEAIFPVGLTNVPQSIYNTLLIEGNPAAALVALNNIAADAEVPLSASARYLRALLYDLLNDRQSAKQAYFDLWGDFPNSHWGQLAGAHLEPR